MIRIIKLNVNFFVSYLIFNIFVILNQRIRAMSLLCIEHGHNDHGSKEVDHGGCEHHVDTARWLLIEGNAAPS